MLQVDVYAVKLGDDDIPEQVEAGTITWTGKKLISKARSKEYISLCRAVLHRAIDIAPYSEKQVIVEPAKEPERWIRNVYKSSGSLIQISQAIAPAQESFELSEAVQRVRAYSRTVYGRTRNVRSYVRQVDVNQIDTVSQRVHRGEPVKSTKISKSLTGKIGEALTMHAKGGMAVSEFLEEKANNLPFDVINREKKILYEVKAGLASVGLPPAKSKYDGMKWRLTKGEPSKTEKEWLKQAGVLAKFKHNKDKDEKILLRKNALKAKIEKLTGVKFKVKTIAYIVNPDTKRADMYEFDGLHPILRWRHPDVQKQYKRTLQWK